MMLPSVSPFSALHELRRPLRFIGTLLQKNDAVGFNLTNTAWWTSIFHQGDVDSDVHFSSPWSAQAHLW